MEGVFNLPELFISLVAGAVCGLLFADRDKRKLSFISALIILLLLVSQNPESARWNIALFVFLFCFVLLNVLQTRWLIDPLDTSIPEIVRDFFTALEPFEYFSIEEDRRLQGSIAVALVIFAIAIIPPLTLIAGTLIPAGLAFYFFWHLRGKASAVGRVVRGTAMGTLSLFCAWQLVRPMPEATIVEPTIIESEVVISPQPVTLYGAFIDGASATYASKVGVVRTEDGGLTWKLIGDGTIQDILAAYFIGTHRGWRSHGFSTEVTEDAGRTWTPVLSGGFMAIAFADSINGFLGTATPKNAKNYITTDGGRSWQDCGIVSQPIIRARFTAPSLLWGIALGGMLMQSQDSGCHWRSAGTVGPQEYYSDLFFLNQKEGWVTDTMAHRILQTQDGGERFEPLPISGNPYYLFFQDSQSGWAIVRHDRTDQIVKTQDAGMTWSSVELNETLPTEWTEGQLLRLLKRPR